MKMNYWTIFGMMLSANLLADQAANPAPAAASAATNAATAATTNAPAAQPAKSQTTARKKAKKKDAAAELRTVPLVPGPAVVVARNVNVRGQGKLKSEVVGHVTKGQLVTVLEEVTLKNSGPDEPSAWAKISLPSTSHPWVHASFINTSNKTVLPKNLKLRGGPGEQYSMLGIIQRGDSIKEVSTKGDWIEIEAPPGAYAFVAAQYLKQEATPAATIAAAEPVPTPATVTEPPPVAPAPTEPPPTPAPAPAVTEAAPATNAPPPEPTPAPAAAEEPPPKRIVQREGFVRGTVSIQAPTHFELVSPDNGRTIDYLHSTARDLDLRRYKGKRIIVTGEEALDERWPNTPVITIQRIQVLD